MSLTLLLDLDDTLLNTNLNVFVPAYFQALGNHLESRVPSATMLRALVRATNLINVSEDPTRTLEEVFDSSFYADVGIPKNELTDILNDFYDNVFPLLARHTTQVEEAASFIEWALSCGYRVAIATDPLFPRKATYHRIRWAGIDPDRIELFSTFEHYHFTKTHPAYYAEVLGRLGWPDGPVLMVGNDVERDLMPAHRLGLATYLIDDESTSGTGSSPALPGTPSGPRARRGETAEPQGQGAPGVSVDAAQGRFETGRGRLADLRPWLESVNLSALEPSFISKDAILAIMVSTPAVLHGHAGSLSDEMWRHEPTPDDWAMNEIVCHLRDTEREIHQMQLNLLLERDGAFIPRPETGIWANERQYHNVHGPAALTEFTGARMDMLKILKEQNDTIWSRRARHAIFGPTNFREVIGFIADHDRLHVQQAWKTLQSIHA